MSPIRTGHHDRSCLTLMLLAALAGCTHDTGTPAAITLSAATALTSGTAALPGADVIPQSLLAAPASTTNGQHRAGPSDAAGAPISAQGIRGDVLAQALRTETNHQANGQTRFTQAMPWSEVASETPAAQSTFYIDQRILPDGNQQPGAYVYSTRSFTLGAEHNQATLELTLGLTAEKSEAGAEALQLSKHLAMQLSPDIHQQATQLSVSTRVAARNVFSLHEHMLLTWDTPVQTWGRPDSNHVELNVMPGRNEREFGVCFSARLHTLYQRQSCSLWQLPENWQAGQTLTYQGHYLQETGPAVAEAGSTTTNPLAFETRRWLTGQQIHVELDTSAITDTLSHTTLVARQSLHQGR